MGRIGKAIVYLDKADILEIHRKQMKVPEQIYARNPGLIFENGLDYLVDIVKDDGLYKTVPQKAAVYAFNTITRHIFTDGNKRTGMTAMIWFLWENQATIRHITYKEVEDIAVEIASNRMSYRQLVDWTKKRLIKRSKRRLDNTQMKLF